MAASVGAYGAVIGMRALARASESMRVRLVTAIPLLIMPVAVGFRWGDAGYAWGLFLVMFTAAVLLWKAFMHELRIEEEALV